MASYNHITLVGNLTRDPEIRYVAEGGKAVTKFSLAINRKTKAADEVMFIDIVAWDRLGETCNQYLKKGMAALVDGRLVIREYTDKDGAKKKAIEVVARDMQILTPKGENGAPRPQERQAVPAGGARRGDPVDDFGDPFGEDEIPFLHDPREFSRIARNL